MPIRRKRATKVASLLKQLTKELPKPRRRATGRTRARASTRMPRRRAQGKFGDWLKGAAKSVGGFLKNTKLLSKVAPTVMNAIPALAPFAGTATTALQSVGLGRRRRMRGQGTSGRVPAGYPATMGLAYVPLSTSRAHVRF